MKREDAQRIVDEHGLEFDIDDSCFGDNSKIISFSSVFDSEDDAEEYLAALKTLCQK